LKGLVRLDVILLEHGWCPVCSSERVFSELCGFQPFLCDPFVCPWMGVDHVVCPFFGWDLCDFCVDKFLQRDEHGVEFGGEPVDYCDVISQVGEHRVLWVAAEHEGFGDYDLAVALGLGVFEHVATIVFVFVGGYAFYVEFGFGVAIPQVVYADHEAEDVGSVEEAVFVPSEFERSCGVAAYAGVYHFQIELGVFGGQDFGDDGYVSFTQGADVASACGGNAVAGEEDCLVVSEFDTVRHFVLLDK
jgi:hypothetical protein